MEAEENSHPRGLSLNRTTASQIVRGSYKGEPSDGTIRAIGWLAGVDDEDAFAAAGRRSPGLPFAEELPPGVDDLSPKERRAAIEMLRTLVAQRREINRYVDSSSGPQEPPAPRDADEDKKTRALEVLLTRSLHDLYARLIERVERDTERDLLIEQATTHLRDSTTAGLDPAAEIEPEAADLDYVPFLVARLSDGPQGDAQLFAALHLDDQQRESVLARFRRERSELTIWGDVRTRGVQLQSRPDLGKLLRVSYPPLVAASTSNVSEEVGDLPAAARRGGGKSEGRRRREQQDRDAEDAD